MINNPVEYSPDRRLQADEHARRCRAGEETLFWDDDEYVAIRAEIKNHYKIEQDYRCSYCQNRLPVNHNMVWDTEHIVSKVVHPQFMLEPLNLCIACKDCNGVKGETEVMEDPVRITYPQNGAGFKIIHAHFDNYDEHIRRFGNDHYASCSKKGAFTIHHCGLYRFASTAVGWDASITPKALAAIDEIVNLGSRQLKAAKIRIDVRDEMRNSTSEYDLVNSATED